MRNGVLDSVGIAVAFSKKLEIIVRPVWNASNVRIVVNRSAGYRYRKKNFVSTIINVMMMMMMIHHHHQRNGKSVTP
jgi:hypothetical protein